MAKYLLLENSQVLGSFKFKGEVVTVPDDVIPALSWEALDSPAQEAISLREERRAEKLEREREKKNLDLQKHLSEKEQLLKELEAIKAQRDSLEGKLKRVGVTENVRATKPRAVSGAVRGTDADGDAVGGEAEISGEASE